jgi:hypothetical protein
MGGCGVKKKHGSFRFGAYGRYSKMAASSSTLNTPTFRRGGRGRGAAEIVFWKEDAQVYYEMELWGVLYAPDVRGAVVAGSYVESVNFEIEVAR